jgi:hypothetical protein
MLGTEKYLPWFNEGLAYATPDNPKALRARPFTTRTFDFIRKSGIPEGKYQVADRPVTPHRPALFIFNLVEGARPDLLHRDYQDMMYEMEAGPFCMRDEDKRITLCNEVLQKMFTGTIPQKLWVYAL